MKICASCGAEIKDGMKFCGGCGAVVPDDAATQAVPYPAGAEQPQQNGANYGQTQQYDNQQVGATAAPKQPNQTVQNILNKVKKNPLIAIIPAAALIAVIVLIIVVANLTKYQKIDAKELFRFEFEGLNNYGTVTGELNAYPDYVYIANDMTLSASKNMKNLNTDITIMADVEDYLSEGQKVSPYLSVDPAELKKVWTKAKDPKELVAMRRALLTTTSKGSYIIKADITNGKNLKNGDKVKVKVNYDEEALKKAKIKLTNTEFEVEVKNLEEGIDFDPFDEKYLSVKFEGVDGSGTMKIDVTSDTPEYVYYECDSKYSSTLKNGDKVKVTCSLYSDLKPAGDAFYFEHDKKYYIVKSKDNLSKEFEVKGLTELNEIDVFENIKFKFERGTPFLNVSGVDNDDMEKIVTDNIGFTIDNGSNLKAGDKFKVKAYAYSSLKSEGYKIKGEVDSEGYVVKEFTVDDTMPAYVTADNGKAAFESGDLKDMISDEESELKEYLQNRSAGWLSYAENVKFEGEVEKVDSLTLKDVYVSFTDKNNYSNVTDYVNRVYGVYDVKVKTDDEEKSSATFIAVVYIDNVISGDGKYYKQSSWDDCKYYFYGSMADFNKQIAGKEGYTLTKCGGGSAEADKPDDSKPEETTTTTAKPEKDDSSKADEKSDESKADEKEEDKDKEKDKEKETEKADEEPADEEKAS